ncbi:MAG: DUF5067 domain-containing protein [Tyzzerella sp.]|nr:DUF5067 domain-containing protein [Tyzzerella sp.]
MSKEEQTKVCKHCQTEIPKKAKVCPNCRKKQGGILKWIIIIVIVIAAISAMTGGDDEPKKVGDVQSGEEGNKETGKETKDTFSLGEIAELDGVRVTMTNYQESAGSEWNKPTDGNVFMLVEFEIENNSEEEIVVSSMMSFEAYADDYAANVSFGALVENEQTQLDGTVAPGKKMKGWIGYEIPSDWADFEIHFIDSVWSDTPFKFTIEK